MRSALPDKDPYVDAKIPQKHYEIGSKSTLKESFTDRERGREAESLQTEREEGKQPDVGFHPRTLRS